MKRTITLLGICASLFWANQAKSQCEQPSALHSLDINNVDAMIYNGGNIWSSSLQAKYEVPAGSGINAFYSSGLWIGGLDSGGQVHFAASRFSQFNITDYFSGPLDEQGMTDSTNCQLWDYLFKVDKSDIDAFLAGGSPTQSILRWPGSGNPHSYSPVPIGDYAPFEDVNGDGTYDPYDGDYPKIKGDQAIWWIFNDAGNVHTETGADPVGIQVAVMAYAYATNNDVNNATFYEYTITKKSDVNLSDAYVGIFTDFDLGNAQDDYIGFDKSRHLSFVYNGDNFDEDSGGSLGYHADPPKAGIQFVQPPLLNNVEQNLNAHVSFNNGVGTRDDPSTAAHYYLFSKGYWKDGTPITLGGVGYGGTVPSPIMYDISDTVNNWTECSAGNTPGDRRSISTYGPFDYNDNDVIQFTFAAIWSRSNLPYVCDNYDDITSAADVVQAHYDSTKAIYNTIAENDVVVGKVYPVPATDELTIEFKNTLTGPKEITLYDPTGRQVYTGKTTSLLHTIPLHHLSAGMYILHAKQENQLTRTPIIIK